MTPDDVAAALPDYAAGVEAELTLLKQLRTLAQAQHDASQAHDLDEVNRAGDARDRIMAALVRLEHEIKPIRLAIAAYQQETSRLNGYATIVALHQTAAALVSDILHADRNTLAELKSAEATRRLSAQAIESGEATLAAYRRVLTPVMGSAGLVDRQG